MVARMLYGAPVLLQDWDTEETAASARYWELFLDLLLVAAASATADGLKDNPTMAGVAEFCVIYYCFINSWLLYTHHITTRFEDGTLLHTLNFFVYLLGFAQCIINAGYDTAIQFSRGAILQRLAVLIMLVNIYVFIPRARQFCTLLVLSIVLVISMFLVASIRPELAPICWWIAVAIELSLEFAGILVLKGNALIPLNVEHTRDRFGCIVLVMLGETVVSATILYREMRGEETFVARDQGYNIVLSLEFLLVFMFTLMYFHMDPPMADHAIRRSRIHGAVLIFFTRLLGLALLAVGVSVKMFVVAVIQEEMLPPFASRLMGISIGVALTILFLLRVLHYGGRMPRPFDPPDVKLIMWCWWVVLGVLVLVPFGTAGLGWTDPVHVIAFYSGLVFFMTVLESTATHILAPHLIVHDGQEGGSLLRQAGDEKTLYHSTSTESTFRGT